MTATLAQTPLHAWHVAHGGRMVDFAGWSMPVQYSSIVAEHRATRGAAGLFDVSHMARVRFEGPAAEDFLDRLVTRRFAGTKTGQVRYALITNHEGGILDDVLVYHLENRQTREPYYLMVVNASNRRKIVTWIEANRGDAAVDIFDRTHETAMISIQGPRALDLLRPHSSIDPDSLKYYTAAEADIGDAPGIVSRTGYTGEDGWEVILPADAGANLWQEILAGPEVGDAMAAGLGCRDTLRLEAGMPLYGHELDEHLNPYQAGLAFAVNLEGRSFPGSNALAALAPDERQSQRVGLEVASGRIAREGDEVFRGAEKVGTVTSGTFSPTLERAIAMAYLDSRQTEVGTQLEIDVRGRRQPARVVKLPFYQRQAQRPETSKGTP